MAKWCKSCEFLNIVDDVTGIHIPEKLKRSAFCHVFLATVVGRRRW